jgi:hypothetical protein
MGAERNDDGQKYKSKAQGAACLPEKSLVAGNIVRIQVGKVHAKIGGEEGQGQENDGDGGEDQNGLVLAVCSDGEFVLLDGAELEELCGNDGLGAKLPFI